MFAENEIARGIMEQIIEKIAQETTSENAEGVDENYVLENWETWEMTSITRRELWWLVMYQIHLFIQTYLHNGKN